MSERLVRFADLTHGSNDASTSSSYQLLALPPALLNHLVASTTSSASSTPLEIRGDGTDAAVLVTETQTYSLRGVQNSNSLCVCTGTHPSDRSSSSRSSGRKRWFGAGSDDPGLEAARDGTVPVVETGPAAKRKRDEPRIEIETVLHETLELVPTVARLEKLPGLLRGTEYSGNDGAGLETSKVGASSVRTGNPESMHCSSPYVWSSQLHTFDTLRSRLPASDAEIRTALSRHRVVTHDGFLRPLPPAYLLELLPAVLSALPLPARLAHPPVRASKKPPPAKGKAGTKPAAVGDGLAVEADEQDVLDALDAVDCSDEGIARQLLGFFGDRDDSGPRPRWKLEALAVVKELGVVLLAQGGVRPVLLLVVLSGRGSRGLCLVCGLTEYMAPRLTVWATSRRTVPRPVEVARSRVRPRVRPDPPGCESPLTSLSCFRVTWTRA